MHGEVSPGQPQDGEQGVGKRTEPQGSEEQSPSVVLSLPTKCFHRCETLRAGEAAASAPGWCGNGAPRGGFAFPPLFAQLRAR